MNDNRITLFFNSVSISFIGTAEQIRGKRYDFSQFGPIISGIGKDWDLVAIGAEARAYNPVTDKKQLS